MDPSGVTFPRARAPTSFDDFYRRFHSQLVRAMVLTLNDGDLGTEAADEAMARAFQRWATVSTYNNPEGWTYRVALNWARNRLRRRHREVVVDHPVEQGPPLAGAMDLDLHAAVQSLAVKLRAVIVLRYYLDWSIEEVAKALAIPKGTVKSRLHHALHRLSDALETR